MNEDSRNDHGSTRNDVENASPCNPSEQPSRREFLVEKIGVGALAGAGALAAAAAAVAQSPTRVAAPVSPSRVAIPQIPKPEALSARRVVTLNVKLPNNVDLKTNIERVPGTVLALETPESGQEARALVMDLTSKKTQDWLKPKKGSFSVSGTNCCCVRG
jgi:hypothetical protein